MKQSQEPAPFAIGCVALVCYPAFLLSIPCFLFGAIHFGLCLWGVAGAAFGIGIVTDLLFGERSSESAPSRQRVAYHREVHASETVYYRPRREPKPSVGEPEPSVTAYEIPLSEYPPCKDPVTGRVYTAGELREKLMRERFGEV
jgi:hypothetical protein